jgi:Flp pilus assembly protein TadG
MRVNGKARTSPVEGRRSRVGNGPGILKSSSGQSLLEVALLTPMLLALLLGAIELGRYAYMSILVGNAARAGAAYGAQSLALSIDVAGIATAADNDFQNNGQNISTLVVSSSTSCGCDTGGSPPIPTVTNLCSTQSNPGLGSAIASCSSPTSHWVIMVSVTASGTFNSLFNYPGIPSPIIVSNTATLRVAQT